MSDEAQNIYQFSYTRKGKEFLSKKAWSDESIIVQFSGGETLDEMLEKFENFLRAVGFLVDRLENVSDEE